MRKYWRSIGVAVGMMLAVAVGANAVTSDVFEAHIFIRGVSQWSKLTRPKFHRMQITQADLINLGLGRPLGTTIPDSERLALVSTCPSNDLRLIVYDTSTSNNLMTVGELLTVSTIERVRGRRTTRNMISELLFGFSNNSSNGLSGGVCFVSGVAKTHANGCLGHYTGNLKGALGASFFFTDVVFTNVIDVTITNLVRNTYFVVSNFPVNISSAPLTSGRKLGTLIEP